MPRGRLDPHRNFKINGPAGFSRSTDPRLRAIAEKACRAGPPAAQDSGDVNIVNDTGNDHLRRVYAAGRFRDYLGFGLLHRRDQGLTVKVLAKTPPARASVDRLNRQSRFTFLRRTVVIPTGFDCSMAQQTHHNTIIEPYFHTRTLLSAPEYPIASCYDISVIPRYCTETHLLQRRQQLLQGHVRRRRFLQFTGEAFLHRRADLYLSGAAIATNGIYAATGYPIECGNPTGSCIGNSAESA